MIDLSACDYYQGIGTCSFGCESEPACLTSEPREGWLSGLRQWTGTDTERAERQGEFEQLREDFESLRRSDDQVALQAQEWQRRALRAEAEVKGLRAVARAADLEGDGAQ